MYCNAFYIDIDVSFSMNTSGSQVMVDPHKVLTVEMKSQLASDVISDEEELRQDEKDEERYEYDKASSIM